MQQHIIHQGFIEDHSADELRSGEGSMVQLADGSLCLIYTEFEGPGDAARAALVKRLSTDGGITWSDAEVVVPLPENGLNVMSVSLLNLPDGRIACVFLNKRAQDNCRPNIMFSSDKAGTWTGPKPVTKRPGYYIVNNDRLVQLSDGRLLAPCAWAEGVEGARDPLCGCLFSDDLGASWQLPKEEIRILPEHYAIPPLLSAADEQKWEAVRQAGVACQEPGAIELSDGRVMMWVRTDGGYVYRCFSSDRGETWSPLTAIADLPAPCGPQSVARLPDGHRLVMVYNDKSGVGFGNERFQWRVPLSVAVSDNEGRTWRSHSDLETDQRHIFCYTSVLFVEDQVLFSYYQSREGVHRGLGALASLKIKILKHDFFAERP